jgi:hypothetical protein
VHRYLNTTLLPYYLDVQSICLIVNLGVQLHEYICKMTAVQSNIKQWGAAADLLQRKIVLATEGFTTKFCGLVLKDRNRLSKENALIVAGYIIAMKREINPRQSYIRYTIQFLSELSRITNQKYFKDMTDNDIFHYLDSSRKPESQDSLHKWIGSYNTKRIIIIRLFKWLYYQGIDTPKRRNELSRIERKPECIMDIPQLKRKEKSC